MKMCRAIFNLLFFCSVLYSGCSDPFAQPPDEMQGYQNETDVTTLWCPSSSDAYSVLLSTKDPSDSPNLRLKLKLDCIQRRVSLAAMDVKPAHSEKWSNIFTNWSFQEQIIDGGDTHFSKPDKWQLKKKGDKITITLIKKNKEAVLVIDPQSNYFLMSTTLKGSAGDKLIVLRAPFISLDGDLRLVIPAGSGRILSAGKVKHDKFYKMPGSKFHGTAILGSAGGVTLSFNDSLTGLHGLRTVVEGAKSKDEKGSVAALVFERYATTEQVITTRLRLAPFWGTWKEAAQLMGENPSEQPVKGGMHENSDVLSYAIWTAPWDHNDYEEKVVKFHYDLTRAYRSQFKGEMLKSNIYLSNPRELYQNGHRPEWACNPSLEYAISNIGKIAKIGYVQKDNIYSITTRCVYFESNYVDQDYFEKSPKYCTGRQWNPGTHSFADIKKECIYADIGGTVAGDHYAELFADCELLQKSVSKELDRGRFQDQYPHANCMYLDQGFKNNASGKHKYRKADWSITDAWKGYIKKLKGALASNKAIEKLYSESWAPTYAGLVDGFYLKNKDIPFSVITNQGRDKPFALLCDAKDYSCSMQALVWGSPIGRLQLADLEPLPGNEIRYGSMLAAFIRKMFISYLSDGRPQIDEQIDVSQTAINRDKTLPNLSWKKRDTSDRIFLIANTDVANGQTYTISQVGSIGPGDTPRLECQVDFEDEAHTLECVKKKARFAEGKAYTIPAGGIHVWCSEVDDCGKSFEVRLADFETPW